MTNTLATTVFEEDVEDQITFYLMAAVALGVMSIPENHANLIKNAGPFAEGISHYLTPERIKGMAMLSKNTARELTEESQDLSLMEVMATTI